MSERCLNPNASYFAFGGRRRGVEDTLRITGGARPYRHNVQGTVDQYFESLPQINGQTRKAMKIVGTAGALALGTAVLDSNIALAAGNPQDTTGSVTQEVNKNINYFTAVVTSLMASGKELYQLIKNKDDENLGELIGNAIIGGVTGYAAGDLGQTAYILGSGGGVVASGLDGLAKITDLPVTYLGARYIVKTTRNKLGR